MLKPMVATAALAAMMLAPSAMAVHGEEYDAFGVATKDGTVYYAHVHWGGYWSPFFTVTIKDLSNNVIVTERFNGQWTANGPVWYFFEVLAYHGWAWDGSAHFDIQGVQAQQVAGGGPQRAIMYYTGNYWDYALQLVVPYGITAPL